MSRLWIPGGRGMLGTRLAVDAAAAHDVVVTDRDTDITDRAAVAAFLDAQHPACIAICAAWTAVDQAEQEPDAAFAANATGPRVVAEEAARRGIRTTTAGRRCICATTDAASDADRCRRRRCLGAVVVCATCAAHAQLVDQDRVGRRAAPASGWQTKAEEKELN